MEVSYIVVNGEVFVISGSKSTTNGELPKDAIEISKQTANRGSLNS